MVQSISITGIPIQLVLILFARNDINPAEFEVIFISNFGDKTQL